MPVLTASAVRAAALANTASTSPVRARDARTTRIDSSWPYSTAEAAAKTAFLDARWDTAIGAYREWLVLEPDNVEARFELAAGYSVDAQLSERRLARHYVIAGWVDAPRAAAAVELIRDRVQRLRADADTAARAFVTARKKVLGQLVSRLGSASWLATRVEQDIELERDPMSELQTAASVKALTP